MIPLAMSFDVVMTLLRAYTEDELAAMAAELEAEGWVWEHGQLKSGRSTVTYLIGYPDSR